MGKADGCVFFLTRPARFIGRFVSGSGYRCGNDLGSFGTSYAVRGLRGFCRGVFQWDVQRFFATHIFGQLVFARDVLMPDSFACLTIGLVKIDFAPSLSCRKQLNTEGNQRDLELTGPIKGAPCVLSQSSWKLWGGSEMPGSAR